MVAESRHVWVAYVGPTQQVLRRVESRGAMSVRDAIEQSNLIAQCPEIDLSINQVGIFGKLTRLDQILEDGDRVEIYRPLIADPKEARKQRAADGKAMRKGGSVKAG